MTRTEIKEKVFQRFLKGIKQEELQKQGELFKEKYFDKAMRLDALARVKWHQKQGHRLVMVTANVDVVALPFAKALGFDDVIATKCEVSKDGKLTGNLLGINCWGKEKIDALERLVGKKGQYTLYAYGDSRGDFELLQSADYAYFKTMS